jgi:hypothetical protein
VQSTAKQASGAQAAPRGAPPPVHETGDIIVSSVLILCSSHDYALRLYGVLGVRCGVAMNLMRHGPRPTVSHRTSIVSSARCAVWTLLFVPIVDCGDWRDSDRNTRDWRDWHDRQSLG